MRRSKSLALSFLLGALLVGGALGFTADRVLVRDCSRSDRVSMRQKLADDLRLTPAQRVAVDSILDRRHREMNGIFATVRPQLDSARQTARAEIRKLLDADQQTKFQQLIAPPTSEKSHK